MTVCIAVVTLAGCINPAMNAPLTPEQVKTKVTYYSPEVLAGTVQEVVNKPATSTPSVPAEPVNLTPTQAERIAAQESKQRAERRRLSTGEDERDERRMREDAERE